MSEKIYLTYTNATSNALQRAGLMGSGSKIPERFNEQPAFDPVSGETSSRYVPGFETTLKNPIDTETPLPFPLDVARARRPAATLLPIAGAFSMVARETRILQPPTDRESQTLRRSVTLAERPTAYRKHQTRPRRLLESPLRQSRSCRVATDRLRSCKPICSIASGWTRANRSNLRSSPKG